MILDKTNTITPVNDSGHHLFRSASDKTRAVPHTHSSYYYYTTTLHPFNGLFSRTTTCKPICTLLQTDNHANTLSLNFYRPDALTDAELTVSKH